MKPNRFYFRTASIFCAPLKFGMPVFAGFTFLITGLTADAGDILRGGSASAGKGGRAAAGGAPIPAAANAARVNARDTLARTTRTMDSIRAMQKAARKVALQNGANNLGKNPRVPTVNLPDVPNGLGAGGLQVSAEVALDPSKWTGATLPTQNITKGKTEVTIKQTAQQALLEWQTFNVGKNTKVTFDQTKGGENASQWVAFNKITDPTGNPTQILGSIKADGQIYLINPNGIIFGGGSQVNARGLTASSLPVNTNLIQRGLLNNSESQFLFDGLGQDVIGDVTVQAGAKITSTVSADGNGGRVMLVGANVSNGGTISTPAGQTILAAGLQVGIAAHLSSDPSLRGLDTYVGAIVDPASTEDSYAGTVTNSGLIESRRANVTLTGKDVRQLGVIDGSTSLSLNGRIDLLANYGAVANTKYTADSTQGNLFLYQSTGSVTLGEDSVTRILPEYGSKGKVVGTELALRSQFNLQGRVIHLDQNSTILAPNAKVSFRAGRWVSVSSTPYSTFIADGGQVYLNNGATIDLAGTANASASVLQNYLTLDLRGAELAVAPLQRDGKLRGDEITVDITKTGTYNGRDWIGTPLADVSGFVGLIERDIAQLTTEGGTLDISAGGSVVLQKTSKIDVSGGWTKFTGDVVNTTQLWSGGNLIDISAATPDQVYDGIFNGQTTVVNKKWGVSNTFNLALAPTGKRFEAGYTQGAGAGSISISAPSLALDGTLLGKSLAGPKQERSSPTSTRIPATGTLTIRLQAQLLSGNNILTWHPGKPDVIFRDGVKQEHAGPFTINANGDPAALPDSRNETVYISPDLFSTQGFGRLTVENAEGNILLPEDVTLSQKIGGSLTLKAANINILGNVIAPGGSLSFTAYNISPYAAALLNSESPVPAPVIGKGIFNLGANATLNAAGLITDDRKSTISGGPAPLVADGGSISISAYDVLLKSGGSIDVSGGYVMQSSGKGDFGKGGSISIRAGQDPGVQPVIGGTLELEAQLSGYSGKTGGTLSLQAPHILIAGTTTSADTLSLVPELFNKGGFGTFNITGVGGGTNPALLVAPGAVVAPVVKSLVLDPDSSVGNLALNVITFPAGTRQPVSLNLSAPGVRDLSGGALFVRGDVVVGEGSVIRTDAGGSVSVTGNTVSILGSIITPGGTITVAGGNSTSIVFNDSTQPLSTTYLGTDAVLSAKGAVVLLPNVYKRRIGSVLGGGTITIGGNVAASEGAMVDASGTSGVLELDPGTTAPLRGMFITPDSGLTKLPDNLATVPTGIDSDGGNIILKGGQMLFSDATLLANAGGKTALGGTLSVSSGRYDAPGVIPPASSISLTVGQNDSVTTATPAAIGAALGNAGHFALDSFVKGGFDSLTLGGVVSFEGAVDVNSRGSVRVATDGFLYADSQVRLTAAHVALGMQLQTPKLPSEITSPFGSISFSPTFGSGNLIVQAGVIDVGSLSLQNIGQAQLLAENGDIRGNGTFHIAGDLTLRAGQIYPVTATSLSFIAYDHDTAHGSISIPSSGTRQLPLSAGGTLGIYASVIDQQGTLRAPFGTINIGWDGTGTAPVDLIAGNSKPFPITSALTLGAGSITSVSGVDPLTGKGMVIPYGVSIDGENWIDPRGVDITTGGLPNKNIVLSGQSVTTENGSSIDLRGGGDLQSYRWIPGLGGPKDILASDTRFAIIPGYSADFAPVSNFNSSASENNLIGDSGAGYANASLQVGDRIYVAGSKTLAAGYYTLLPARYALLSGGVLVSANAGGGATATVEMADKSSVVSGFRYNSLNDSRELPSVTTRFELAASEVFLKRAEYGKSLANVFLKNSAEAANAIIPRLPTDSGQLVFQATQEMSLSGGVMSDSVSGGRGSQIDISTPLQTIITSASAAAPSGVIILDAAALGAFGAESLLIGGRRTLTADGVSVLVRAGSVTVDNAGSPLSATDLVLVANDAITIAPDAELKATGTLADSDVLLLEGSGALIRISANAGASVVRTGVSAATSPVLSIGAKARFSGGNLILDSTSLLSLDASADLDAKTFTLSSGRVSLLLKNPGTPLPDSGLFLTDGTLRRLSKAESLSILSYSSIDLYGTGSFGEEALASLTLSAGEIRGFHTSGGTARITASELLLQNAAGAAADGSASVAPGTLMFDADVIHLGTNQVSISGYENTVLNAASGIVGEGNGGLSTVGSLKAITPVLTGAAEAKQMITAGGALIFSPPVTVAAGNAPEGGLGSSLVLTGLSVSVDTGVALPSGSLTIRATTGDVEIGGLLDASGTRSRFHDVAKFTSAGAIQLSADAGDVILKTGSLIDISANEGGGNGGVLGVSVRTGEFDSNGTIRGKGSTGGVNGSFELDTATLPEFAMLGTSLSDASLTGSQKIRVRGGDVLIDGLAEAYDFALSADQGSIRVSGTIDASAETGGSIHLTANGDVATLNGAVLTVGAEDFSNAGKGGSITLEAGSQRYGVVGNGLIDIRTGSRLDLSVASKIEGDALTRGSSAWQGDFSGKLHLRAPQVESDLAVKSLNGTIIDSSAIIVEGYRLYDLTSSGGAITSAVQTTIKSNATTFLGANVTNTEGYTAITTRLLENNDRLASVLVLTPGVEIINRTGNLTLGTTSSTTTADWNLSAFRFGEKGAAGVLTLRAAGDVVFRNALSDGFSPTLANTDSNWLWTSRLTAYNALLPANSQSWSYRISAGADLSASASSETIASDQPSGTAGSLKLGKISTNLSTGTGSSATTASAIANRFQVIRTGSGDIDINASGDVQLLNQFATIYTAGTRVQDPTLDGTFRTPSLNLVNMPSPLGVAQQSYAVQYSMAGGDVNIQAGRNIERLTLSGGVLVADSQFQMPTNWLYRRGFVDSENREFGVNRWGESASTTWWVDFSNFFQGVGALAGGDVTLIAGENISNVDAVVPTNARMPGYTDATQLQGAIPDDSKLVELGGGNLIVRAGSDIDAGVYYVERGDGILNASGSIHTNATRSVLTPGNISAGQATSYTELPTTVFVGKGGFDVSAGGDLLLGPVANPFLLPGGLINSFWHKTYFSTFATDSYLLATSLGGDVTLRTAATAPGETPGAATPLLQSWYTNKLLLNSLSASSRKPWLRLSETDTFPFTNLFTLHPGNLETTSFSGDINLVGNLTLSPSPTGRLDLLAAGSVNALQPNGLVTVNGVPTVTWGRSSVNLSDADPVAIPGIANPFGFQTLTGPVASIGITGNLLFLDFVNRLFSESGGTIGENSVLQVKQALHAAGLLHRDDDEPTRIYAGSGDISGLTLFSPKVSHIFAGQDISDVAFYLQNNREGDTSIVTNGRDLTPYNSTSALQIAAQQNGNVLNIGSGPQDGDIQISGPGMLQVLAGRNLDLGTGSNNSDGTGAGITSIGNSRNPYLPFRGANIVVGAGIGASSGISTSQLNISSFISDYVMTPKGAKYLKEITPGFDFTEQSEEEQARLAIEVFYRILRDAGRKHAKVGNYKIAKEAIMTLFGRDQTWDGDIRARARDIRTTNGGGISIIAPGGGLQLAETTSGNPLSPPGIITASGGNIFIFANNDISIGIGRIFTLRGGNEILWSSEGDIAAGSSSKTVKSAPPTRVLINPQSADVQTDLAGLATGGGIGVLATVAGVKPGDVDLIAPNGTVDAGDAGIRVSGNLNIAASQVLNAGNISVGGVSTGTPAPVSVSGSVGSIATASSTSAAAVASATTPTPAAQARDEPIKSAEAPSIITVEVTGYGEGDDEDDEEENPTDNAAE